MVTTLILILGGVLLAALAVIYFLWFEAGDAGPARTCRDVRTSHGSAHRSSVQPFAAAVSDRR